MVEPVIGLAQPDQHRRIEPVLRFRPLDADQQHAAAPLYQDIAWLCGDGRSGRCGWSAARDYSNFAILYRNNPDLSIIVGQNFKLRQYPIANWESSAC